MYTQWEIILLKETLFSVRKCDGMKEVSKCKLQIEKQVNHMIVMASKYERHSEYFAMDQEKYSLAKKI